jgi:lysozyme
MKVSPQGIVSIKKHESCKLKAYKVGSDRPTIGWGNTFYEDGTPVKLGDTITQDRADKLFLAKLADFEKDVNNLLEVVVNQGQFDALVSFAYNVGSDIDADTKAEGLGDSTLLKKVNANPDDPSIRNEFMKWVSKGSIFEKGLTKRRKEEADAYYSTFIP